jgi:hypothetical protein
MPIGFTSTCQAGHASGKKNGVEYTFITSYGSLARTSAPGSCITKSALTWRIM